MNQHSTKVEQSGADNGVKFVDWVCKCGAHNREYADPFPAIAECEACGEANDDYMPQSSSSTERKS